MKNVYIKVLSALLFVPGAMLAQNVDNDGSEGDDIEVSMSLEMEKKLSKKLSFGLEGEMRSRQNATEFDRLSLSPVLEYKIIKHLKFSVGGAVVYTNNAEKEKYRSDGSLKWVRPSYWQPRYRGFASLTGDVDLGRFNISLRERYQLTYRPEYTATRDYFTPDGSYNYTEDDIRAEKTTQVLRSRLMVEYDIAHSPLVPFVSAEVTNDLSGWDVDKVRYTAGVDWKVNKKNVVTLAYMYQDVRGDDGEDDVNSHIISLTYKYKF